MKNTVRISFDVPIDDHCFLKSECAKSRIPLRDFMQAAFQKALKEYRESQLKKRLRRGIKEAKEGKGRIINVSRFKEFADE